MIAFLKSLLPHNTPAGVTKAGRFTALQERILQWVLLIILLLGGSGIGGMVATTIQNRDWTGLALYTVLYGTVVAITILRSRAYPFRAGLLLAVLFVLDVQLVLKTGLTIGAMPFFFASIFLSGLFFGIEMAAVILGLGLAVGSTSMMLPGSAWRGLVNSIFTGQAGSESLITLLAFAAIGGLAIFTVVLMNRELNRSVRSEIEARERAEQEHKAIETRVKESNEVYQRRLQESHVAAQISRTISSILDPDELLQHVVDQLQEKFKLYYVGVFVLDGEQRFEVLRAGSGEAGKKMLADGHRLPVNGTSMIGWVTLNKQPRVALDVGQEAVRFNNPNLPFTRSELALPIQARGEVLGAMTVQSNQPNAFEENDIIILQGIADSLAVALENARLYRQTQDMLEEVRQMNQEYLEKAWLDTLRLSGGLQFSYENSGETPSGEAALKVHQFPLMLRDQVIGYITLESDRDQLTPEESAFIEAVTSQTAVALENARLLEESQRHAYEEQKLNEISEQFSAASSVEDILRIAVRELGELPSAAEVSIHLVPPQDTVPAGSNGGNGRVKEHAE